MSARVETPENGSPEGWVEASLSGGTERVPNAKPEDEPKRPFGYVDVSSVCNESNRITDHKQFRGSQAPSRARRPIRPSTDCGSATGRKLAGQRTGRGAGCGAS